LPQKRLVVACFEEEGVDFADEEIDVCDFDFFSVVRPVDDMGR
jgi:hypothetical protein